MGISVLKFGRRCKQTKAWPDRRYFKLNPLCEALVAIFDEHKPVVAEKHTDGHRHYDDVAKHQSVLLVRTGHEDRLSAPISFDSLRNEALPLARNENTETLDIIRVPLLVGVYFVANLLLREEAAFPDLVLADSQISEPPDHTCMKWERDAREWGEERLVEAQKRGEISRSSTTTEVQKAVLYGHKGLDERSAEFYEPYPFRLGWI